MGKGVVSEKCVDGLEALSDDSELLSADWAHQNGKMAKPSWILDLVFHLLLN
jgi:hypothetical protein